MRDTPTEPPSPEPDFDTVREDAAYQLTEDQYAAFILVGMTDDGRIAGPKVASDGNRIPPVASRADAITALVAQVLRDRLPDESLADLVARAADVDLIEEGDRD